MGEARVLHREAARLARDHDFEKLARDADAYADFAQLAEDALRIEAAEDTQRATDYWIEASKIRPDHWVVKQAFERLGLSE